MYHYISEPEPDADIYRRDLSVGPAAFRAQLEHLRENGYTTVSLYELTVAIAGQLELPPKPVVLTFDDGYRDQYENAFPLLQEFGFTGTFFLVTDHLDNREPRFMTWEMVEEMSRAGMSIEPHSRDHPDLRGQPWEYLIWQILGSQETIAAHIGYWPRYFAFPSGEYDDPAQQALAELDFWGAVTTEGGRWHGYHDRLEWRRLRIRQSTDLAKFAQLLDPE
jgi:peptidoglycan/xylan/chitin deacetylase (PgdA/CDA1 family)